MRLTIAKFLRQARNFKFEANRENSVMVQNVSWLSSPSHVKEYFLKYGDVKYVNMLFDENQGIYKGYGFVEFINQNSVQEALDDYNRPKLDGNILHVVKTFAAKKDKK